MTTHTPGPPTRNLSDEIARPYEYDARKNGRWGLACGCQIFNAGQARAVHALVTGELALERCPTHAHAPAMLRVLQSIVIAASIDTARGLDPIDLHDARALLRAVEG